MKQIDKQEALERLRYTCSRSEKCLLDIRKKLYSWNLIENYEEIKDKLISDNFINEERFANSFVNDKIKYSKWGKVKVRYALRMKDIDEAIINSALNFFQEEDYKEIIYSELQKKTRRLKSLKESQAEVSRLYRFAAQRGYESDIVKIFISEITD